VIVDVDDACHGVEAVVDQYWAAAVLARQIGAELLVVLTTDGDALVPTEAAAWFTTTTGSAAQVMPLGGLNGSRVTARPTPG
jgi:carbamate kinase